MVEFLGNIIIELGLLIVNHYFCVIMTQKWQDSIFKGKLIDFGPTYKSKFRNSLISDLNQVI